MITTKNILKEDNLCIICIEEYGVIKLCKNCKYKYCKTCSEKINNQCSICLRNKININNEDNDFDFDYLYNSEFDNYYLSFPIIIYGFLFMVFMFLLILIFYLNYVFYNIIISLT